MLLWVAVRVKEASCPIPGLFDPLVVAPVQMEPIRQSKVNRRPLHSAREERATEQPLFSVQRLDFLLADGLQSPSRPLSGSDALGRSVDSTFSKPEESRTIRRLGIPQCLAETLESLLEILHVDHLHRSTPGKGDMVRTAHLAPPISVPGAADLELDVGVAVPEDVAGVALGFADGLGIDFSGAV